ncbi:unnamed protein product [Dimorphilus gyrociliatus]|uniref:Uncharacterized protein n=1 Tax=Dimorphilus gyrociliatus TaxID=2664684 RepID=A0A7I8W3K6_9ANNE|nr:unnamed protein product [Dimorphilus gyrociliatus]
MSRKSTIREKDVDEFLKKNKAFASKWFKANMDNLEKTENEPEETVTEEDELAALNYTNTPSRQGSFSIFSFCTNNMSGSNPRKSVDELSVNNAI